MESPRLAIAAFVVVLLGLQGVLGSNVQCEELPVGMCAFSISSSGARCVLEKSFNRDGSEQYECQSSAVTAENIMMEWIETEECLTACGLERMAVGLSSDALMESGFIEKLCSANCLDNCPNIVDLYINLAAGEGISLPLLCEAHRTGSRRLVAEVLSSARSSITSDSFEGAPASL